MKTYLEVTIFALVYGLSFAIFPVEAAVFVGPTPYLSSGDIPVGFYAGGVPVFLDDFEDGTLDGNITASAGYVRIPSALTDSVDADDGLIDGFGTDGRSFFGYGVGSATGITFTFATTVTAAGIVLTDGVFDTVYTFEAFGLGMVSLGTLTGNHLDSFNSGQTAEDRFYGVRDVGGIIAINIRGSDNLEVDHIQYGVAVPEPMSLLLIASAVAGLLVVRRFCWGILAVTVALMFPFSTQAADWNWICGDGNWSNGSCWSPSGQPTGGSVSLSRSTGVDITAVYQNGLGGTPLFSNLWIQAQGGGSMTLSHATGDWLRAVDEYIGYNGVGAGTGHYLQSNGQHTITNSLYLGYEHGATGTYELSGVGELTAIWEFVGHRGDGSFSQSGGTHSVSTDLYIGYLYAGSLSRGAYDLSGGILAVSGNEWVGHANSPGSFTHDGGTHSVSNNLYLGHGAIGTGTYSISGTGSVIVSGNEFVGYDGTGIVTQDGGTHDVGTELSLGHNVGSDGSYDLFSGDLTVMGTEHVGYDGTGGFAQSGGTHTASSLTLGNNAEGSGSYNLVDGGLTVTGGESVGASGAGAFTQSGGSHDVAGWLVIGAQNSGVGTYDMSGGTLTVTGDEYVGGFGNGTFNQSQGTHEVTGTLYLAHFTGGSGDYRLTGGLLTAANVQVSAGGLLAQAVGAINADVENDGTFDHTSGTFAGRLVNRGTVNLYGDFHAGDGIANYADLTIDAGRSVRSTGAGFDNQGSVTLAGGALEVHGAFGNDGTIIGHGTIDGTAGLVNNASIIQSGGHLTLSNTGSHASYGNVGLAAGYQLRLTGGDLTNCGTLNLNDATVAGTATLSNAGGGAIIGRGTITSGFANNGGVLLVEGGTTNVVQPSSNSGVIQLTSPAANLVGGAIANTGSVEGVGHVGNDVVNGGTIESINGTLTLSGNLANNVGSLMTAGVDSKLLIASGLATNAGTINLTGGTFDNNGHPLTNSGQISGHGVVRTGGLTNEGSMTLSGEYTTVNGDVSNHATGRIEVAYAPALFTGDVTNHGVFKTTGTTVSFAGTYTENGTFLSDPSDNYFIDLVVEDTGALIGGLGDRFFASGDFLNSSSQAGTWDTVLAEIILYSSAAHLFGVTGVDVGPVFAGLYDNFAWGTLTLDSADTLTLYDGNAASGGALYVDTLLLADGLSQLASIESDGLNIYYNPSSAGNDYFAGETYALAGGGLLAPMVPEPISLLLVASAVVGLVVMRRRGSQRGGRPLTVPFRKRDTWHRVAAGGNPVGALSRTEFCSRVGSVITLVVILQASVTHASLVTFTSQLDPSPDVLISPAGYGYQHNIADAGFNPATDTLVSAELYISFSEEDGLSGSDDSVSIFFDGYLQRIARDPGMPFVTDTWDEVIPVSTGFLADDGILSVVLQTEGSTLFQISELTVQATRAVPTPSSIWTFPVALLLALVVSRHTGLGHRQGLSLGRSMDPVKLT